MAKPHQTPVDFMVIALSPALIMALVGSLCFFLIEVFYRGQWMGALCWVMFWFVVGIVMVARIAIETSPEHAGVYGFILALVTWFYLIRTYPAYLIGMVLLGIVWFCSHKLVWDCTLIDDEADASGFGLLQKPPGSAPSPAPAAPGKGPKKKQAKPAAPQNPGRWVVYFSVVAVPLFGIGQMLLPPAATGARRAGLILLVVYMGAALGLLITTSFLGLRRYLRQRYLKMPPSIAWAWLKFGVGVGLLILVGSLFMPRPGANAAWSALSYKVNEQLRRASEYASPANRPGQGKGSPGQDDGGTKDGGNPKNAPDSGAKQGGGTSNPEKTGTAGQSAPAPGQGSPVPGGALYNLLRTAFAIIAALVVGFWVIRNRHLLLEMARALVAAIRQFLHNLANINSYRKPAAPQEMKPSRRKLTSFSEYKNPFFAVGEHELQPEEAVLYTFEAVQVWARENGSPELPTETPREFCTRLAGRFPYLGTHPDELARLYGYAAYGKKIPPSSSLEALKELWRILPVDAPVKRAAVAKA